MTFTTPRTWVLDEIPSEATLNTHIRDQYRSLMHSVDYAGTVVDVTGTTDANLYTPTIPAGEMGANGLIDIVVLGDYQANGAAGTRFLHFIIHFGPSASLTKVLESQPQAEISAHANRQPFELRMVIANKAATNAQRISATLTTLQPGIIDGLTGIGNFNWNAAQNIGGVMANDSNIDTTVATSVHINARWTGAGNSVRRIIGRTLVGQN